MKKEIYQSVTAIYTEKLNSKEIAAVTEISPSLVRMKLSRINEKLRRELKRTMDEER